VESVWNQSKYGDLANWIPHDVRELHRVLDETFRKYRHDPRRLLSFFTAAQLPV
jgi:hypothetical protein